MLSIISRQRKIVQNKVNSHQAFYNLINWHIVPLHHQHSHTLIPSIDSLEAKSSQNKEILKEVLNKTEDEQDRLFGNSILRKFGQKDGLYHIPGKNKVNTSTILGNTTLSLEIE